MRLFGETFKIGNFHEIVDGKVLGSIGNQFGRVESGKCKLEISKPDCKLHRKHQIQTNSEVFSFAIRFESVEFGGYIHLKAFYLLPSTFLEFKQNLNQPSKPSK